MIAIVLENGNTYATNVIAVKWSGWSSEIIAYDSKFKNIKRIKIWQIIKKRIFRIVFIINESEFDCKKGKWQGYEWLINNKKLFKTIKSKELFLVGEHKQLNEYAAYTARMERN